jgi:hypothetical protein
MPRRRAAQQRLKPTCADTRRTQTLPESLPGKRIPHDLPEIEEFSTYSRERTPPATSWMSCHCAGSPANRSVGRHLSPGVANTVQRRFGTMIH